MPPLVFPLAASVRARPGDARKLGFADVKKAYLHAPVRGGRNARLPEGNAAEGARGKLNVSLYGTRGAARNWGEKYVEVLSEPGSVDGESSRACFGMGSATCGRQSMEMASPLSAMTKACPGSNGRWKRNWM